MDFDPLTHPNMDKFEPFPYPFSFVILYYFADCPDKTENDGVKLNCTKILIVQSLFSLRPNKRREN